MWPVRKFSSLDGMHPGTGVALIGSSKGPWKSGFFCFYFLFFIISSPPLFVFFTPRPATISCPADIRWVLRSEPYVAETNLLLTPGTVNFVEKMK